MKKHLLKIPLIKWLDDFTDTNLGHAVTALAVILAIAMFCFWRALK